MLRLSMRLLIVLCAISWLTAAAPPFVSAQTRQFVLPPGFVQEVIADGLGPATAFAIAPDGRILIARKGGSVKLYRDGQLQPGPFIDLSSEINHYADRGLMGIAVHPNFPNPAYVYFAYTYEPPEAQGHESSGARVSRVLRVEADPRNLDKHRLGSETVLLGANGTAATMGDLERGDRPPYSCTAADGSPVRDCLPVDGPSHTVDGLAFGPDGALYVSAGDATLQPELNIRAQDVDSLAGKLLRINPITGQGYADNPFFDGDLNSNRSKVYALGMRNPFRFTFAPDTGRLVVGDVGGERWEEINQGAPGANFGWPCFEGPDHLSDQPACAELFTGRRPVTFAWYSYPHANAYSAAIGGDFYTGSSFPAAYGGAYFFADHNRAALLYLTPSSDGTATVHEFATNAVALVQIKNGPEGDLYVLSFTDGTLSRIRYAGGDNRTPLANAAAEPTSGLPPLRVAFTSAGSADPDGGMLTVHWVFGDGAESNEANPLHTYDTAGHYVVQLTVTDGDGATALATTELYVGGNAPVVQIVAPTDESTWPIGAQVDLHGEASDVEDGALSGANLRWDAVLHHNEHVHPDYFAAEGATSTLIFPAHGENSYLTLCLTATDSAGLSGHSCVDLHEAVKGAEMAAPAVAAETDHNSGVGHVLRERWIGLGGATVADLTRSSRFPNQPDEVDYPTTLDSAGVGKDYAERLRGYLQPPVEGEYRFWIASDDSSEFWLSSDGQPANARLIAGVATWTGRLQWDKSAGQLSEPIHLQGGQRYYLEILHKQADQKDHLSLAWQIPGEERSVISGEALSPWLPNRDHP